MAMKATQRAQSTGFSQAKLTFDHSIKDAEQLLDHCESLGDPLPQNAEVFKRAGLVMALTAWETYIEDRVVEGVRDRVGQDRSYAARFMIAKLKDELKRFHNPDSARTERLFRDYLAVDVTSHWKLQHLDSVQTAARLDVLLKKRGDAVHRSKTIPKGSPIAHLVKKDDLAKAIRFLKELVIATDKGLAIEATAAPPAP